MAYSPYGKMYHMVTYVLIFYCTYENFFERSLGVCRFDCAGPKRDGVDTFQSEAQKLMRSKTQLFLICGNNSLNAPCIASSWAMERLVHQQEPSVHVNNGRDIVI